MELTIAQQEKTHASPKEIVNAWLVSSSLRDNIMNPDFTHIESGYDEVIIHWTQMFIQK